MPYNGVDAAAAKIAIWLRHVLHVLKTRVRFPWCHYIEANLHEKVCAGASVMSNPEAPASRRLTMYYNSSDFNPLHGFCCREVVGWEVDCITYLLYLPGGSLHLYCLKGGVTLGLTSGSC